VPPSDFLLQGPPSGFLFGHPVTGHNRTLQSKFFNSTIVVIVIAVKGGGTSSHETQLMVVDSEGEFNQDDFAFGSSFKTKYDQLVKIKNVGQCFMVLVKNVIATTTND
jgi:hypothetical protein